MMNTKDACNENELSECFWNELVENIIRDTKIFNESNKKFSNEFHIAETLKDGHFRDICKFYFNQTKCTSNQNEIKSDMYRREGNLFFKNSNMCYALESYTSALFSAKTKFSAAFCHANRAATLIKLEYFEEAFDDCEAAIECNYPEEKILKVLVRQGYCGINLKNERKIQDTILALNKLLKTREVKEALYNLEEELKKIKTNKGQSEIHKQSTYSLEIQKKQRTIQDAIKGRSIIAEEDIFKDDKIAAEKAFAFVPIRSNHNQISFHCDSCGKTNIIPFPCYKCCLVSYCSLKCRKHFENVHRFECLGIRKKILTQTGFGHLALRTFLIGADQLVDFLLQKLNSGTELNYQIWEEVNNFKNINSSNYANVLGLNTNLSKLSDLDFKRFAVTGSMLMMYLKYQTNYFENHTLTKIYKICEKSSWQSIVSALLLRHVAQMVSNAHAICDFEIDDGMHFNIWKSKCVLKRGYLSYFANTKKIFAAIFPYISLYNHSCKSTFCNRFDKTEIQIFATEFLKKNEEIFNCYGKNVKLMDRGTRIKELEAQYHFKCLCSYCFDKNDSEFKKYHTLKCLRSCCKHEFIITTKWWERDNNMINQIKCPKCEIILNMEWLTEFEEINYKIVCLDYAIEINDFKRIFELFRIADLCLAGYHCYKQNIIANFLKTVNILSLKDTTSLVMFKQDLMELSLKNLGICEEIYSLNSLNYVTAVAYYIDLFLNLSLEQNILSSDKIKKSLKILSEDTRKVFENYLLIHLPSIFLEIKMETLKQ